MNAIITIIGNTLRVFFSSRGNLIGLTVLPILFTVVLGWTSSGGASGPTRQRIDLLDMDNSALSARFMDELRATNETLVLCPMDNDEGNYCRLDEKEAATLDLESATERAKGKVSRALIVIPAGYGVALQSFGKSQIDFYSADDPTIPNPVLQTVQTVVDRANNASLTAGVGSAILANVSELSEGQLFVEKTRQSFANDLYQTAETMLDERPESVRYITTKEGDQASPQDNGFNQTVPGMGSMYVMFTVLGGMALLYRERTQWTLQRLGALPISRAQILGGKIGAYFLLGMIQYLIVFGVGALFGIDFSGNPLALLAVMASFALCITALTFALANFATSEDQANGIARLLALSLAPLGGAWWPLEIVPDFMRQIGHLSPVAWAMDGFQDLIFFNGGFVDILPEVGVLLAISAVFFGIGVRSFRVT